MVTAPPSAKKSATPAKKVATPAKKVATPAKKVATPGMKLETPAKKVEVARAEPTTPTELDDQTFVSTGKLTESLNVVKKLQDQHDSSKTEKKSLFEADNHMVHLQVELKKIPANFSTFIHSVALPRHWRHQLDFDTCLIVSDVNKEPLTDRDLDIEQTKGKYFDILEAASATELIKDILPTRQLRNEFRPKALKVKLSSEYSAFLCDRKLMRNKHSFLARFLGKAFWVDQKRVPIPIDLEVAASELRPQIESKLNETPIYVSGKGSTLSITIGSLEQSQKHLLENLQSVLIKIRQIFTTNIRSLTVKTEKSPAVMFYMDLGSSNEIPLPKNPSAGKGGEQFVEDDFDFLTNSSVRVYRGGKIKIVSKKRKLEEGEEEEKQGVAEQKFIRGMNRSFLRGDHDWVRHKVPSILKTTRKAAKRLPGGSKSRNGPRKLGGKRFFSKKTNGTKVEAKK